MTQNKPTPQFKVWDNNNKKWLNDFFIDKMGKVFNIYENVENFYFDGRYFDEENPQFEAKLEKIEYPLICRFTGLFDKNNVPVYEHDVIRLANRSIIEVTQDNMLILYQENDFFPDCGVYLGSSLSNPELLEVKE